MQSAQAARRHHMNRTEQRRLQTCPACVPGIFRRRFETAKKTVTPGLQNSPDPAPLLAGQRKRHQPGVLTPSSERPVTESSDLYAAPGLLAGAAALAVCTLVFGGAFLAAAGVAALTGVLAFADVFGGVGVFALTGVAALAGTFALAGVFALTAVAALAGAFAFVDVFALAGAFALVDVFALAEAFVLVDVFALTGAFFSALTRAVVTFFTAEEIAVTSRSVDLASDVSSFREAFCSFSNSLWASFMRLLISFDASPCSTDFSMASSDFIACSLAPRTRLKRAPAVFSSLFN